MSLHAIPRGRDVVREQIRVIGLRLRREALVGAAVLAIVTIWIAVDFIRGNAASWFDSDGWFPLALAAFLFPFAVWREKPFGPAFLWTFPVDRRRLAFAKTFAGWVWLMIALAAVVLWQLALAAIARVPNAETISPVAFLGTTVAYLFGSALVVGLRHPLRWLLAAAGVLLLLGMLSHRADLDLRLNALASSSAVQAAGPWWPFAMVFALSAAMAALWVAVSRHRETR